MDDVTFARSGHDDTSGVAYAPVDWPAPEVILGWELANVNAEDLPLS